MSVCGNGIIEPGESCDDDNKTDGDCCSSACQLEAAGSACSDADACTSEDTCDGGGHCVSGTATVCDDGDRCTDDPQCDPAIGCPEPIVKGGLAGVSCHLDGIGAALTQAAADQVTAGARARIMAALQMARVGVTAAARAGHGKRGAKKRRSAEMALRRVEKVINAARRKHQIEGPLAATLVGQVNGALGGAQSLLTPF